jgi:hypothetical protein
VHGDRPAGVLGGLLHRGAAGQHDQVGKRDLLATRRGAAESGADLFERLQHLCEALRLVRGGYVNCCIRVFAAKESALIATELRLPELALLAGTRGMLGAGVGLLLADKLSEDTRKGIGWALVAIGVLTTIPLAMIVFRRPRTNEDVK